MTDESWHLVKNTPKVTGFVGGVGMKPTPITKRRSMLSCSRFRRALKSRSQKYCLRVGESVRVTEARSPISNGVVEHVDYDKNKLRVSVAILAGDTGGTGFCPGRKA